MKYPTGHLHFVGYSMVYQRKTLHNFFMPCHRKYSGEHNQCDISAVNGGKVWCNIFKYRTAFLYCNWLYFRWYGIKLDVLIQYVVENMLIIGSFLHLLGSFSFYVHSHHSCWRLGRESSGRRQDYHL